MYIEQDFFLEMYLVKGKKLRNSPFLVKSIANYKMIMVHVTKHVFSRSRKASGILQ